MSKKKKNLGGRPTLFTPQLINKLEECFAKGYNDYEAYNFVGVSHQAFYNYCNKNPKFVERITWLKNNPLLLAKEAVYEKIVEKDILTAKWYLERKAKEEFSTRVESTGKDGKELDFTQLKIINNGEVKLK